MYAVLLCSHVYIQMRLDGFLKENFEFDYFHLTTQVLWFWV